MSLTGIVNTHTMAATLIMTHGTDEQKRRWLPGMASGERRGALSLSEPDAGSDTRNISCKAVARRRRVRGQRHEGLGDQRRAGLHRGARRPHRGGHLAPSSWRRSPGRRFEGHLGLPSTSASSATGASRRSRCPTSTTASRRPTSSASAGRGLPQILGVLEVGRINIAARAVGVARAAFDAALAYSPRARDLRQAHRRAPGHPAQAGRHGHPARGGSAAHRATRPNARRPGCAATSRPAWPSSSPARRRSSWPPRPCGSTAAWATPPSSPSSATTATRRSW